MTVRIYYNYIMYLKKRLYNFSKIAFFDINYTALITYKPIFLTQVFYALPSFKMSFY